MPRRPMCGAVPAVFSVRVSIECVMESWSFGLWAMSLLMRRRAPICLIGMLRVPQRATTAHDGDGLEVLRGRRRGGRPFKGEGVPRIGALGGGLPDRCDEIEQEDQDSHEEDC